MFPSLHKFLVDHFARIIFAGLDMDSLLYNGVGTAAKSLAGAILVIAKSPRVSMGNCGQIRRIGARSIVTDLAGNGSVRHRL